MGGSFPSYQSHNFQLPSQSNQQSKPSKPHSTWTSSKLCKPVWALWGTDKSKSESRPKPTSGGASGSAPVASTSHGHHSEPQQATFQYSRCTGKKKALCVGVFVKMTIELERLTRLYVNSRLVSIIEGRQISCLAVLMTQRL